MVRSALPLLTSDSPLIHPTIDQQKATELAFALKAFADPVRLQLLSILAQVPNGKVRASALANPVGRSQSTVSHHLKALRSAGLVQAERQGSIIWYSLCRRRFQELWASLDVAALPAPANPARTSAEPAARGHHVACPEAIAPHEPSVTSNAIPATADAVSGGSTSGITYLAIHCDGPSCICSRVTDDPISVLVSIQPPV